MTLASFRPWRRRPTPPPSTDPSRPSVSDPTRASAGAGPQAVWTTPTGAPHDFTTASREALVEALVAAGPGHRTLCEGWQTEHLAAHIHLRETSALAAGLALKPWSGPLERRTRELGDASTGSRQYQQLVDRVARGTAGSERVVTRLRAAAPVRRAAQAANLLEFFVHTEDVRRAQDRWAPRRLSDDYADVLWEELSRRARLLYRTAPTGVRLVRTPRTGRAMEGTATVVARPGEPQVTITGPTGELIMHAFGRRDHALVLVDPPGSALEG
ncbi:TIGR03085 family metal-binding protein [Micrococcus terreus]|uniref:TIGR03085 family protein n=1 Tax=Micrococcus terreus TaxID=574650 RepID=A0A1I7MFQ1_9MICC|nr:TIGR03085 family metal-binding protein [Micrococcus terreus]MCT2088618.1 TIGR03085 family metal-binding protein [Micrococcus terreus]MDK7701464.1 TIGR03085 family metal-binding protein [Micrococcus terreus]WOO98165.1 TIGR03085 family metal-binding protein [Micrococcus terreus]SFV20764.1 TIGR03085 family protein [Micrococcus terreus]